MIVLNRSCLVILFLLLSVPRGALATTLNYTDFSSPAGITINGNASVVSTGDGSVMRLVSATSNQSGSFFSTSLIDYSTFSTKFSFRLTNPSGISDGTEPGADGFAFVIQALSSALGGSGQGLGYDGISPSVAVEFDTFENLSDPNSNHIGIDKNGSTTSVTTINVTPNFDNGELWYSWINYDGGTLEVRLNNSDVRPLAALLSYDIDISSIIGGGSTYVGFTGATGGAYENMYITSWQYQDNYSTTPTIANPEPSTILLMVVGVAGAALVRSRREKTHC